VNLRLVFIFICSLVVFTSCKKQSDNLFLANEGTVGFDGYSFIDSLNMLTSTVREDSLKTDSLSHNLIGVINDAEFGRYEASSFFQFKLPQVDKVVSTQTLDSVVLFIQYTSNIAYYGDLNSELSFKVYELSESMNSAVTHSNQTYAYNPTPVGSFTGKVKLTDSMQITQLGKRVKVAPGISIKLSTAMAQKLFNASATDLKSSDNFLQYFKGLAIVPDNTPAMGSGIIAAVNLKGAFTKLRIYYNDSLQSDFGVIDNAKRFSQYKVSGQGNLIKKQKASPSNANFDTTFVQAMAGAKTKIQFPNLFSIITKSSKKISIGKAEIIIRPLAGSFSTPFSLPTRLLLLRPDPTTNLNAGIIDLIEPFYGGKYNSITNEYRFNITRHVQSIFTDYQLNGKNSNNGLFIVAPSDNPIMPSRIILDTKKHQNNAGIEFELVYTEL
jgi:hypothetical protein